MICSRCNFVCAHNGQISQIYPLNSYNNTACVFAIVKVILLLIFFAIATTIAII